MNRASFRSSAAALVYFSIREKSRIVGSASPTSRLGWNLLGGSPLLEQ